MEALGLNLSLDRFTGAERGILATCLVLEEEEDSVNHSEFEDDTGIEFDTQRWLK